MKQSLSRVVPGVLVVVLSTAAARAQCNPIGIEDFDAATPTTTSQCNTTDPGTLPLGWTNGAGTTSSWRVFSGATPSGGTGPTADHTTGSGNYVYVEVSGCSTAFGYLESPCFDATGVQAPTLSFWYHMYGATMGALTVQQMDATGGWQTIWNLFGDQGNAWQLALVPVVPVNGEARFRFFYVRGADFTGDCSLDDIAFGEPTTGGNCVLPYDEDFEGATQASQLSCNNLNPGVLPAGWTNVAGNDSAWRVNSGSTPSSSTGPSGDHTTGSGQYIYVETSGCATGDHGTLEAPCYWAQGVTAPALEFWYHMYGADMGTLTVQQYDGAGNWNSIWTISGDQGNQWHQAAMLVTPVGGLVRVRFHYERGENFRSDCALDDVRFGEPTPGDWEINLPGATLDIDGVTGSTLTPVRLQRCTSEEADLNIASVNVGLPYDVAINAQATVPASGGGVTTTNGQHVNINVLASSWLYGGAVPSFSTLFPGNFTILVTTAPFVTPASTQMFVFDPGHADGVSLSQATQVNTLSPQSVPGPSSDEEIVTVTLAGLPLCGPATIPFYGTAYDRINVHSNGRISFGTAAVDFTASPGEAMTGPPFAGFWTDLDASFGSVVLFSPNPSLLNVIFANVRYHGESPSVTFSIQLNAALGTISLNGLAAIPDNPQTGPLATAGDRQFLGISSGSAGGATDPGPVVFTPGGSGTAGGADMIYDHYDHLSGGPAIVPSLQGGLQGIVFTPSGSNYSWSGF